MLMNKNRPAKFKMLDNILLKLNNTKLFDSKYQQ